MLNSNYSLILKFNKITISAVYLLILVGGIVRSTGSGMGCPDWPKCFGLYIPPLSESELPDEYEDIYTSKRLEKNQRLANLFSYFGFDQLSDELLNSKDVASKHSFDFVTAWIEYLNRLLGVVVGLLILINFFLAIYFSWKVKKLVFLSFASLLLVVFQGWTGSIVVSSNLLPGLITFHMLLAVLLVAFLLYTRLFVSKLQGSVNDIYHITSFKRVLLACIVTLLVQLLLGTQVREAIDLFVKYYQDIDRINYIDNLGLTFLIHRSYSIFILVIHLYFCFIFFKSKINTIQTRRLIVILLLGTVILEIASGVILAYFALPYYMQPLHLFLAFVLIGVEFYIYNLFLFSRRDG